MVSKIEPDRYADTGFSVNDTAPEINSMIFQRMMQRSSGERLMMGMDMQATARALVWASIPENLPADTRRRAFFERFYGEPSPW
jgi:hypothetical protein